MTEKTRIRKIAYCCFYLGLFLELLIVILDKSNWQNVYESSLFRLTFCLFVIKALCTRYTVKEYVFLALAGLLSILSWRISGRDELVRFVAFVAACRDIPVRQLMKTVFYVTAAGCAVLILLSVTGIYGGLSLTLDFGRGMVQTRYCLGMGHPNALHCMMLMLMILGLYLYDQKVSWWGYLMLFLGNIGLYLLTDSRIGTVIGICAVLLAVLMRYVPKLFEMRWVYGAGMLAVVGIIIFSTLASSVGITSPIIQKIDEFLNHRIWCANVVYGTNIRHWGLFSDPSHDQFFDMGFIRMFYWYGMIPGLLMAAALLWMLWDACRRKDAAVLFIVLTLTAYTTVEAHLVSVYIGRNYLLMLFGCMFGSMLAGKKGRTAEGAILDLLYKGKALGKK